MANFNPVTAGLGKILSGLGLLALAVVLFLLIPSRLFIGIGALGFVLLCWGLMGGGDSSDW